MPGGHGGKRGRFWAYFGILKTVFGAGLLRHRDEYVGLSELAN